jgi:hypothetical protein
MLKKLLFLSLILLMAACAGGGSGGSSGTVSEAEITASAAELTAIERNLEKRGCSFNFVSRHSSEVRLTCNEHRGSYAKLYTTLEALAIGHESFASKYYGKTFDYQGEKRSFDDRAKEIFLAKATAARKMMEEIKPEVDAEKERQRLALERRQAEEATVLRN